MPGKANRRPTNLSAPRTLMEGMVTARLGRCGRKEPHTEGPFLRAPPTLSRDAQAETEPHVGPGLSVASGASKRLLIQFEIRLPRDWPSGTLSLHSTNKRGCPCAKSHPYHRSKAAFPETYLHLKGILGAHQTHIKVIQDLGHKLCGLGKRSLRAYSSAYQVTSPSDWTSIRGEKAGQGITKTRKALGL